MKLCHYILLLLTSAFLLLLPAPTASAASTQNFFMHQNTVIAVGETVENVVVVGGDATVGGTVRDVVIVFNGNLDIKKSAHIHGFVFVMGGKINQEPGAILNDNVVNVALDNPTEHNALLVLAALLGVWLLQFIFSLLMLFVPTLTAFLLKERIDPMVRHIQTEPRQLIKVGFVTSLLFAGIAILLSVTVIGIPIFLILLLLSLPFFFLGTAASSVVIGEMVPVRTSHPLLKVLSGALVITAAVNVPFLGTVVLLVLVWISFGLMVGWLQDKRKGRKSGK
ncbi:hypothetical protein [Aneurinibacillus terranovensis]|uniref:hypothetical protein n=1 Tax=Aneurinibacillus terranovensis TaxID=278991 RepID=UPI00040E50D0|nr:hypothetical protein [Aneurinibacillus terranovensis]